MFLDSTIDRERRTFNNIDVGKLPVFILRLPYCKNLSGLAWFSTFYLRSDLYLDLFSDTPSPFVVGLSLHEVEHLRRAKNIGFVRYFFKSQLNHVFRYQEELACHKPQFSYYKSVGYAFDLEQRAKIMSGSLYRYMVDESTALKDLQALWQEEK